MSELKLFSRVHDKLTVSDSDDLILKGTRTVIPRELCQRASALAHEGTNSKLNVDIILCTIINHNPSNKHRSAL